MRDTINLLAFILGFILIGTIAIANADTRTLRFAWDYDAAPAAMIDGFRLYEDGVAIKTVGKTIRTVDTPQLQDRLAHTYHLTAYQGTDESGPSDFVTVPAYMSGIPRVIEGSFRFQILDGNGQVIGGSQ